MYTVIGTAPSGITVLLDLRTLRLSHRFLPGLAYPGQIIDDAMIAQREEVNTHWRPDVWGLWPFPMREV